MTDKQTASWSVGLGTVIENGVTRETVIVNVGYESIYTSPESARRMATLLLLCAEDAEKESKEQSK